MRPPSMSGHFLLAPIPESSSDYLLPRDIKLAVLGAGRVGKSGECLRYLTGRSAPWAGSDQPGVGKSRSSQPGEEDIPPTPTPGFSLLPEHLSGQSLGLAPLEDEGRCSRLSTCSRPRHQRHGDRDGHPRFAESAARSSLLLPDSVAFDGPVRALHLVFLFHFQQ